MNVQITALLQGLGLGLSLIVAIGAQNAFVLRQGLRREYIFITALTCASCDAMLITLGVGGMGAIITGIPFLNSVATWGGAAFLGYYGFRSFRSALKPDTLDVTSNDTSSAEGRVKATAMRTFLAALAFSLLNPHVYLDTVVLLGSVGAQRPIGERPWFAFGAMVASFAWFFGLAYGASRLAPLFRRPIAWRVLDTVIGCIMWTIALSLALSAITPKA